MGRIPHCTKPGRCCVPNGTPTGGSMFFLPVFSAYGAQIATNKKAMVNRVQASEKDEKYHIFVTII